MALAAAGHAQAPVLALVGVHVIAMDREHVLERQTLLIRDGRIVTLGAADAVAPPAGARIIDGSGKFVIPALGETKTMDRAGVIQGGVWHDRASLDRRLAALAVP